MQTPDVGHLVDLFSEWIGDEEIERKILVENAGSLYSFQ